MCLTFVVNLTIILFWIKYYVVFSISKSWIFIPEVNCNNAKFNWYFANWVYGWGISLYLKAIISFYEYISNSTKWFNADPSFDIFLHLFAQSIFQSNFIVFCKHMKMKYFKVILIVQTLCFRDLNSIFLCRKRRKKKDTLQLEMNDLKRRN